jgi:hypothetical protein
MIDLAPNTELYVAPVLIEYGSVVELTGACDGPCIDGAGGMNVID